MNKSRNLVLIGLLLLSLVLAVGIPAFMKTFFDEEGDEPDLVEWVGETPTSQNTNPPVANANSEKLITHVIDESKNDGVYPSASYGLNMYQDRRSLGGRSLEEISDTFDFVLLKEKDDYLVVDNSLKGVIERMYDVIPGEELRNAQQMIEGAAALNISAPAAKQFKETVLQYVVYKEETAALDEELNAMNFKPGDVPSPNSMLAQIQDSAFGYEKANALFRAERSVNLAMEKYREEYKSASEPLTLEDWERMNEEYRTIISEAQRAN